MDKETRAVFKAMIAALDKDDKETGWKHDATGTPQASGYSHGPGGSLSYPGVDMSVFSTIVGTRGILPLLVARPAIDMNPLFQVLTGVDGASGSEKTEVCGNAPQAGLIRSCILTSQFARYERATRELEINRMGFVNDRADPMDLRWMNDPTFANGPFGVGPGDPANPGDVLRNEMSRKFRELAIEFSRLLGLQVWRGSPVNNAGSGAYREFTGISVQVNTGHTDAITGVSCPTADSDLKEFNYTRIDGSAANGTALVKNISYMYMTRQRAAETMGLDPVQFVLFMRPEVWWEVSQVWPCSYLTYQCQVTGNQQVQINGSDQVKFRDEMRNGKYLLINGDRVPVVVDDGIAFLDGNSSGGHFPAGCISSDIYLLPMSVLGGNIVTYLEYADYNNDSIRSALQALEPGAFRVEGPFITFSRRTNECFVFQSKIEPRLIMRTPWLAARLQHVVVCPLQFAPQPFPSDPYANSGGVISRTGPSYYDGTWKS
jgi:hypothetical protein